jgi:hypothetical protein
VLRRPNTIALLHMRQQWRHIRGSALARQRTGSGSPDALLSDTPTAVLIRQILGAMG